VPGKVSVSGSTRREGITDERAAPEAARIQPPRIPGRHLRLPQRWPTAACTALPPDRAGAVKLGRGS